MTDIQDMRARLRDGRGPQPAAAAPGGGFRIPFGILAAAAVMVGFAIVVVTPKLYSVHRTAALPGLKDTKPREEPVTPSRPTVAAPAVAQPAAKTNYTGKSPEEAAEIADAVCAQRVAAARKTSPSQASASPAENEKLSCFLSEAPTRFCTGSQKRKATADIINYFKGIEYTNAALSVAKKVLDMPGPYAAPFKPDPSEVASRKEKEAAAMLVPDERVAVAIERLMQAGYLVKGHRDDILANVPRAYKERFGRIVGNKAPCAEPAWWQVWK